MKNLAMDFVNTKWYIEHEMMRDLLEDQEWFSRWLAKYGHQLDKHFFDTPDLLVHLRKMRLFLNQCFDQLASAYTLSEDSINLLNDYSDEFASSIHLAHEDNSFVLKQINTPLTLEAFKGLLSNSLILLIVETELSRLRICDNDECKWLFIDSTKSRTKKWCCNTCASLVKVRKFRLKNSK
ncbi:MAG: hypothetical protein BGO41_00150 [Clostridiales bacterium 38-18]|nr:MAG: hypothetical protein BGO41_00150 [Clostridiales bacterium 38-18]